MQGNPLAIHYAERIAFIRYLISGIKDWIFDQHQLRMEHLERINATGWNQLLQSSDQLLSTLTKLDSSKSILGMT